MRINAAFDQPVALHPRDMHWVASPLAGVERKMLDRIGGEVARATSLVRYAPGSYFSPHIHSGGEEFLVLEGIFSDEHGDFPAGTYVRNPIGTKHKPHSEDGCTILVKLHQFDPNDTEQFSTHVDELKFEDSGTPGVQLAWLHRFEGEDVKMVRWEPGAHFLDPLQQGGSEIYILEGSLEMTEGQYPAGSWIRNPTGHSQNMHSADGCLAWVKTGHLTAEKLGKYAQTETG